MAIVSIYWEFEQKKLQDAINERIGVRGRTIRTFAQIVNTALFSVALKAQKYTPKADPGRIDASVRAEVNFRVNKMGELVPARKGRRFTFKPSTRGNRLDEWQPSVALAYLITLARANISRQGRLTGQSLYNRITNNRWQVQPDFLKGGRKSIKAIAEGMVLARHSSGGLLKAGWKPAMDILRPYIAKNDLGGSATGERFDVNKDAQRLGTAVVAKEAWVTRGSIENHVGSGGTALDERQQHALLRYGLEPFRRALSEEADSIMDKVNEYLEKEARAFNRK